MQTENFRQWLLNQGFSSSGPISNALSRCGRVENAEHVDLDEEFDNDRCEWLLDLYVYTTEDEREGNPARHNSLIEGNVRTGTSSLRSAILKYVEFRRCNEGIVNNDNVSRPAYEQRTTRTRQNRNAAHPIELVPNRNSYTEFFDFYGIDVESLCDYGLTRSVFVSPESALQQWNSIKEDFFHGRALPIRTSDKNGPEFAFYKALYSDIFGYRALKNDATGNYYPRANMEKALNVKVTIKPTTEYGHLVNFQTSHGFSGRTKNPLMYSSLWNIVFTPKVIDPFTGDEASGEFADAFRSAFQQRIQTLYCVCIEEFNAIVDRYNVKQRIEQFQSVEFDTDDLRRMKNNALSQWEKIPL